MGTYVERQGETCVERCRIASARIGNFCAGEGVERLWGRYVRHASLRDGINRPRNPSSPSPTEVREWETTAHTYSALRAHALARVNYRVHAREHVPTCSYRIRGTIVISSVRIP